MMGITDITTYLAGVVVIVLPLAVDPMFVPKAVAGGAAIGHLASLSLNSGTRRATAARH